MESVLSTLRAERTHRHSRHAWRVVPLWLRAGVFLAAVCAMGPVAAADSWEAVYQERLAWWSLQPVTNPSVPPVRDAAWSRNEVDRFILAALEVQGLAPVAEAGRRVLARRLSFALTGLPPKPEVVEGFVADAAPDAYERLVDSLLASPHFGEHWARHWMDVVHYSDTHGYEWDTPAKNAWMYRDYLVRAYNADLPFRQLILEQIAGDLIEARVDPAAGVNEALIGPAAMRLGERRHGDNADAEGVTQEAMANIVDTVSKGFIGTTVACAQCHDHKLDAVSQRDYYGLTGVLMSTRWTVRAIDAADPNGAVVDELRTIKDEVRREIAGVWRNAREAVMTGILSPPEAKAEEKKADAKDAAPKKPPLPESVPAVWRYLNELMEQGESCESAWSTLSERILAEDAARRAANEASQRLIADFTQASPPSGWRLDGFGMKYGLVEDGELVIADEGDSAVLHLLPAGRWSHVWSPRLAAAVRSPLFGQDPAPSFSVEYAGGKHAAQALIVDNSFHSERMKFLDRATPGWLTLSAGNFPALAGGPDPTPRRVYLELATKALNNYFPPRSAYGGVKEEDERDPRSWFGLTRVYEHAEGQAPKATLEHLAPIFRGASAPASKEAIAARLTAHVMAAVEHWHVGTCDRDDVRVINEALAAEWLPNAVQTSTGLAASVARYREVEQQLQADHVIGSVEDWNEGRDERVGVRGSYTEFGESVPRGNIGFLGGPAARACTESSGRLELAHSIASDANPLTARVYVNRVWHHLFGSGLVRTVDDFGSLGELPSHPELLDWLAQRFMAEGWSTKQLVKLLVCSATWRQGSAPDAGALIADPENRLWHHLPMRRLEAESIRDAILAVSGRLDGTLYGVPVDPYRVAQDPAKRLFSGPLDGEGRRSLYQKMTLMEPPKFLALFNQPIPKQTTGRRDTTNVPDQALALLNDPFVIAMAQHWSEEVLKDGAASAEARVQAMFSTAFGRSPAPDEAERFSMFVQVCAQQRGADPAALLACQPVWQDVAHAIFNLKEFIYVQ
ncbi:MAG: DUF1553 domain-containing protein [Candidatus Hydrogenedentes bacterium]|nr:DUF1553 domain-containing protein [Candidatus Hydrogenedentota bacterium]